MTIWGIVSLEHMRIFLLKAKSFKRKTPFFNLTKITIFPVPYVSDAINVNFLPNKATNPLTYAITNMSGQVELKGQILGSTYSITVSDLAPGIYILTVSDLNKRVSYKIIKK